ncbi:MAG: hypothetical protein LBC53_10565 [Spirochaetaceae bacterium]|jgi:hypothetical protein|nr:hypothetical protein [Spirochaetaceae bacterium]
MRKINTTAFRGKNLFLAAAFFFAVSIAAFPKETKTFDSGFMADLGASFDYEDAESDWASRFEGRFVNVELGLGCYIWPVSVRLFCDFGSRIYGTVYLYGAELDGKDDFASAHTSIGGELGFRLYHGKRIAIVLPVGYMFTKTEYTKPYAAFNNNNGFETLEAEEAYINTYDAVFGGIEINGVFNKYLCLILYARGSYPLNAKHSWEARAPKGYVWTETGRNTRSESASLDVFAISAGLRIRVSPPNK